MLPAITDAPPSVAELRALKTDSNPLLWRANLGAEHAGR
jgi:protease II